MMILISNNVKIQKIRPEALFGGAKYRNLIDKKPYKKANKQTIKLLLEKQTSNSLPLKFAKVYYRRDNRDLTKLRWQRER